MDGSHYGPELCGRAPGHYLQYLGNFGLLFQCLHKFLIARFQGSRFLPQFCKEVDVIDGGPNLSAVSSTIEALICEASRQPSIASNHAQGLPLYLDGDCGKKSITDPFGCITVAEFSVARIILNILEDERFAGFSSFADDSPALALRPFG